MRASLNAILALIGSVSLTDEEWELIELEDGASDVEKYDALIVVLDSRDSVSSTKLRLQYYFLAIGAEVSDPSNAKTNIFVGASLED